MLADQICSWIAITMAAVPIQVASGQSIAARQQAAKKQSAGCA
jgi:hypothetical protein